MSERAMDPTGAERRARAGLAGTVDPLDPSVNERIDRVGAVQTLDELRIGASPLRRAEAYTARLTTLDVDGEFERTQRIGARVLIPGDPEWPDALNDLGGRRPVALWARGPFELNAVDTSPSAAIIGARAATRYGEQVAADFAADLAGRGWCVVSGGAYGIDAAAHRGALAVGGSTVAVLANGVDETYPKGNDALLARVIDEGALVSELPPGRRPTRAGFLSRNRLIAALARVTVVVEAAMRSGSASTVARAVELGREVCGVPGPVTSATSVGVHALLRDGATLVTEPAHVVELLAPMGEQLELPQPQASARDALGASAQAVLDAFPARRAIDASAVAVSAGLPVGAALRDLAVLTVEGWVERVEAGYRLTDKARSA